MPVSENLQRLIETNAPLWAGEAEIVRTYWTSPVRTPATDKLWLKRQCWKEYVGVADAKGQVIGRLERLATKLAKWVPQLDVSMDRNELKEELEKDYVEYSHYCLFADVYDALLEPGEPKLNAAELTSWPEEDELANNRRECRQTLGALGRRAADFTEGGYCTLYSEGAALKNRPGVDGKIGYACQRVYDDEFGHMMHGVVGIDEAGLSKDDWDKMRELTTHHLRLRLHMRNAQFSHPLPDSRIKEILAGKIAPVAFDFKKAESYLASHAAAAE